MTLFLLFLFQIEKVFDQFVHFISLEHSMFTLRHQTNYSAPNNLSFYSLNKSDVTDTEMENIINDIVDGLFAICVTLGKTHAFIFTKFILMKYKINQLLFCRLIRYRPSDKMSERKRSRIRSQKIGQKIT